MKNCGSAYEVFNILYFLFGFEMKLLYIEFVDFQIKLGVICHVMNKILN
jgi:hypothetical protein